MLDPSELYDVEPQATAQVAHLGEQGGPVLVHALRGFIDAGAVAAVVAEHLRTELPSTRLVTFDVDQLLDYRARRPAMTFDANTWTEYAEPELAIDLVRDRAGTPFLLLHGMEPDVQWERFIAAVRQVVERFDVSLTIGTHGIPMGVPHTRPVSVTAHGTRPELVANHASWFGTVQVPASVSALLEMRLGEAGRDAMGVAVHVPHYLSASTYPRAAMGAIEHIQRATGLELDPGQLLPAAQAAEEEVSRQLEDSEDVAVVVRALEEQYDAFDRAGSRAPLLADAGAIPTADELGERFEQFLAEQQENPPSL